MSVLAALLTLLSAAGLYAGSPNCRWRRGAGAAGIARGVGIVATVAAAAAWIAALGAGAGLSVFLGGWMLAGFALPWLALRAGRADARD